MAFYQHVIEGWCPASAFRSRVSLIELSEEHVCASPSMGFVIRVRSSRRMWRAIVNTVPVLFTLQTGRTVPGHARLQAEVSAVWENHLPDFSLEPHCCALHWTNTLPLESPCRNSEQFAEAGVLLMHCCWGLTLLLFHWTAKKWIETKSFPEVPDGKW